MSVDLPASVEKELRDLAVVQSREIRDLVEEAVRQYIEAAAITDLEPEAVSETQVMLVGELRDIQEWKGGTGGRGERPPRVGALRSLQKACRARVLGLPGGYALVRLPPRKAEPAKKAS